MSAAPKPARKRFIRAGQLRWAWVRGRGWVLAFRVNDGNGWLIPDWRSRPNPGIATPVRLVTRSEFTTWLRWFLDKKHLTGSTIERTLGIPRKRVYSWRRGLSIPTFAESKAIIDLSNRLHPKSRVEYQQVHLVPNKDVVAR